MPEFEQRVQIAFPSPRRLLSPAVVTLLVLMVVGYALTAWAEGFTVNHLALASWGVLRGQVWQLATYPFVAGCPWNFIFDCLILLFMGSSVERVWRTGGFLLLWLVVTLTCGMVWCVVNLVLNPGYVGVGAGACSYGIIAAFGVLHRRQKYFTGFWTIEAQYLSLILIAIGLILGIRQPILWIWVFGAAVGYGYVKLRLHLETGGVRTSAQPSGRGRAQGFVDID